MNSPFAYGHVDEITTSGIAIASMAASRHNEDLANVPRSRGLYSNMELRQIRYFKAVAELLSFSRAAETLHVAQSALSRQIQALEEQVGARLLERDRTHVALTSAGRAFYKHACKVLLHLDIAMTDARQIAQGQKGEVVICRDWRLDTRIISAAVEGFRRKHPKVEISLRDASHQVQVAMLRSGEAQLGFVARELIGKKSELEFLPIQRVYVNAILPSDHRFAMHKIVRLADLADEVWGDTSEKAAVPFRTFFIQQCRMSGYTPRIERIASSLEGLFELVASGYGITAVPDHVRPRPGLSLRCVRTDCPAIESGVVWRAGHASPLLQQFLAILRQQIATSPGAIRA